MKSRVETIDQLMQEARMLNIVGDWRGRREVIDQLAPMLAKEPETLRDFWRELMDYNRLCAQLKTLKLEKLHED